MNRLYDSSRGRVYVFYGSSSGIASKTVADADVFFTGESQLSGLGSYGLDCGDINKDGFDDIAIGHGYFDSGKGRVYIIYGSDTLESKTLD